jgi:hypothetical protein
MNGNDKAARRPAGFRGDGNCERSDVIFANIISNEDFSGQDRQCINVLVSDDAERGGPDATLWALGGELAAELTGSP